MSVLYCCSSVLPRFAPVVVTVCWMMLAPEGLLFRSDAIANPAAMAFNGPAMSSRPGSELTSHSTSLVNARPSTCAVCGEVVVKSSLTVLTTEAIWVALP